MKLDKKIVDLISEGFKANTLRGLSETQISKLHERISKKDTKEQVSQKIVSSKPQIVTNISSTSLNQGATVTGSGGKPISVKKNPTTGGIEMKMDQTESEKKNNPWAICRAQQNKVGKKKMTDSEVEDCIKKIKKENKKKNVSEDLFIEKKILKLVEKYTTPKMSKKQFLSLLETKTKEKPDVKEKPDTKEKPGTREKPHDPFKPAPHKQPKPKAQKGDMDESVMGAPAKPKVAPTKPGTKTPPKEKPHDPFKPAPHKQPKPKAGRKLPDQLKFSAIGIKFKK